MKKYFIIDKKDAKMNKDFNYQNNVLILSINSSRNQSENDIFNEEINELFMYFLCLFDSI